MGGGEASIVSDPGVQWEMRGAGRVTQLFDADSSLPTLRTPSTHSDSLIRPETSEIGEDSPIFRLLLECGSL